MDTVVVLYTWINELSHPNYPTNILGCKDRLKLNKLKGIRKAQFLAGRLLLQKGIDSLNANVIMQNINYDKFAKPFFDHEINFSISHFEKLVCCAVSKKTLLLGIDTEQHQGRKIKGTLRFFTEEELNIIHENSCTALHIWTKKESIIKACSGSIFQMDRINTLDAKIKFENNYWFLYNINLDKYYHTTLATNKKVKVQIKHIDFQIG